MISMGFDPSMSVAYRGLFSSQNSYGKVMEKLSSGFRINRAADDAAGLAISEGLRSQIRGYGAAQGNILQAINMIQTAEGGMNEIHDMLQSMREKAIQAANDSYSESDRGMILVELKEIATEINRIGKVTEYNKIPLLNGERPTLHFQVGAGATKWDTISVDMSRVDVCESVGELLDNDYAALDVSTHENAQKLTNKLDGIISKISTGRAYLGAVQNRLEFAGRFVSNTKINLAASESRIRDTDMAQEIMNQVKESIRQQVAQAVMAQAIQLKKSMVLALLPK